MSIARLDSVSQTGVFSRRRLGNHGRLGLSDGRRGAELETRLALHQDALSRPDIAKLLTGLFLDGPRIALQCFYLVLQLLVTLICILNLLLEAMVLGSLGLVDDHAVGSIDDFMTGSDHQSGKAEGRQHPAHPVQPLSGNSYRNAQRN